MSFESFIEGPGMNFFASTDKPYREDVLTAGRYKAELTAIKPGRGRSYDGKPPRATLTFCFKIIPGGQPANRTVSASRASQSKLLELVRSMAGLNQPSLEQIAIGDKFTAFLEQLVGKTFHLQISPSPDGRFNNIVGVLPIELGEGK